MPLFGAVNDRKARIATLALLGLVAGAPFRAAAAPVAPGAPALASSSEPEGSTQIAPAAEAAAAAAAAGVPVPKAPSFYVDEGTCPGECCTYGVWTATATVRLQASPTDTRFVASLKKGQKVEVPTGQVHVVPTVLLIERAGNGFAAGKRLYVLTSLGEGQSRYWYEGASGVDNVLCMTDPATARASDCFVATARKIQEGSQEWWVKVKLPRGKLGWTNQIAFEGTDSCG